MRRARASPQNTRISGRCTVRYALPGGQETTLGAGNTNAHQRTHHQDEHRPNNNVAHNIFRFGGDSRRFIAGNALLHIAQALVYESGRGEVHTGDGDFGDGVHIVSPFDRNTLDSFSASKKTVF